MSESGKAGPGIIRTIYGIIDAGCGECDKACPVTHVWREGGI